MSVADKLTKLAEDINAAYSAIEEKGGTVPEHKNTENMADAIATISGGGGDNGYGKIKYYKGRTQTIALQGSGATLNVTDSSKFLEKCVYSRSEEGRYTNKQFFVMYDQPGKVSMTDSGQDWQSYKTLSDEWMAKDFMSQHTFPDPTNVRFECVEGYWNYDEEIEGETVTSQIPVEELEMTVGVRVVSLTGDLEYDYFVLSRFDSAFISIYDGAYQTPQYLIMSSAASLVYSTLGFTFTDVDENFQNAYITVTVAADLNSDVVEYAFEDQDDFNNVVYGPLTKPGSTSEFRPYLEFANGARILPAQAKEYEFSSSSTMTTIGDNFFGKIYAGQGLFPNFDTLTNFPSTVTTIGNYFLAYTKFNGQIDLSNVTTIGNGFLYYCNYFNQQLDFSGVTTIGDYFLYSCSVFNKPVDFTSLTSIGNNGLAQCVVFDQDVSLPAIVTVGTRFLYNDYVLGTTGGSDRYVSLGASVTSVGKGLLYKCNSFKGNVYIRGNSVVFTAPDNETVADTVSRSGLYNPGSTMYVKANLIDAYSAIITYVEGPAFYRGVGFQPL